VSDARNTLGKERQGDRTRWVDISGPSSSLEDWTAIAAKDAISGTRDSSLRRFLWRYGAETEIGRAVFGPLSQTWQALESGCKESVISAIGKMENIFPVIKSLSLRVLQEILHFSTSTSVLPVPATKFILQNLSLLDEQTVRDDCVKAGAAIWWHAPEQIWPLFRSKSTTDRFVAASAAELMQPHEALGGAAGDADLFCAIVEANLNLATSPLVWNAPAPIPRRTAEVLSRRGISTNNAVLQAMFDAENQDVPRIAMELFGQAAVNAAIREYETDNAGKQRRASQWLLAAKKHPGFLQMALAEGVVHRLGTLAFISALIEYNSPSVSRTEDEWSQALAYAKGDLGNGGFRFYAFLLRRALSGVSPQPGLLIHYSFDPVHNDLIRSRSDRHAWYKLERVLPEVPWWNRWDRAHRVRLGVVRAFITHELPSQEFLEITKDRNSFRKLVEIAASSFRGLTYLKRVLSYTENSSEEEVQYLGRIMQETMDQSKDW